MSRKHVAVAVAVLVVGAGGAFLVTAVSKVREASARMSCH